MVPGAGERQMQSLSSHRASGLAGERGLHQQSLWEKSAAMSQTHRVSLTREGVLSAIHCHMASTLCSITEHKHTDQMATVMR